MSIAQRIKEKQDKDGMLRRALERIIQLYTDKAHFVFELLQNAEDAEAQNIKFVQYDNRLEVCHDGKPFTSANLQSLFDIGMSDKIDNLNQIGEFGVGFKSVFSICETVQIGSAPANFRSPEIGDAEAFGLEIINFIDPKDMSAVSMERPFTTKFVFPYATGLSFSGFKTIDELREKLTDKLENLNATTLLFMKSLQSIEYEIHTSMHQGKGCYKLSKTKINDHCVRVQALSDKDKAPNTAANGNISYLVFSKEIDVFRAKRSIDIAFAFKEMENDWEFVPLSNATISVFFPTETESKLKFIVQGPYRTTPNRSSVPFDNPSNTKLAKETAQLLYESVLELKEIGKLNLSFLCILPLQEDDFYTHSFWNNTPNNLFSPVFDRIKELFQEEDILPCRNGLYSNALQVKLARRKDLADLFTDDDLTTLIRDKKQYYWLADEITSGGKYQELFEYLNEELDVGVITPDSLSSYINKNSTFLESKVDDIDWLTKFYTFLISVPALCSRAGNNGQMLTVKFVKNQNGIFVAPYRKGEGGKYLANIFTPADDMDKSTTGIDFVNTEIFQSCEEFFISVLGLEKPQEYDYWVKGLKQRYTDGYQVSDEQHILDIRKILYFIKHPDYSDDLQKVLVNNLLLKCILNDSPVWKNPYSTDVFFAEDKRSINIEGYFKNVIAYPFIDSEFYFSNGITYDQLSQLHIKDEIIEGDSIVSGEYDTGKPGTKPSWHTDSNSKFRWQLYILHLEKILNYISNNPNEKSSRIKSSVIFKLLQMREDYLSGTVYISGQTANIEGTCSKVISVLINKNWEDGDYSAKNNNHCWTNSDLRSWDKKWLYTQSGELVSSTEISKHDLNTDIYGEIKYDSKLYELLKFKKDEIDIAEENLKTYSALPKSQKVSFGEQWLKDFYGITVEQLQNLIRNSPVSDADDTENDSIDFEFPEESVKNWDSLRRHTAELLSYASSVEYQSVLRKIRVSKNPATIKTYLKRAYKVDGKDQFACQLCHRPFINIEMCQLDGKKEAEKELDPMYLCLCPNCASRFNAFKTTDEYTAFRKKLESIDTQTIDDFSPVILPLGNNEELWFTQVHIAEITELLRLQSQAEKELQKESQRTQTLAKNAGEMAASSPKSHKIGYGDLKGCIGKQIRYKTSTIDCIVTVINLAVDKITLRLDKGHWSGIEIGKCVEPPIKMCIEKGWLEFIT